MERLVDFYKRNSAKVAAPIVLHCYPTKIAWGQEKLNKNTKTYVGPLFPGIFNTLVNLEHIYTSFPEGRIRRESVEAGGKSVAELEQTLEQNKIKVNSYARQMMESPNFMTLKFRETFDLVHLTVQDLGFTSNQNTNQIYDMANHFGLDLCPPEIGPESRISYMNQPLEEWENIAMKQITDSGGVPGIFGLGRDTSGLWLGDCWARSTRQWTLDSRFIFRLRK